MKKSFYLKYGTGKEKGEVSSYLSSKWDIECSENDSEYFGVYFLYEGLYADRISITDNFIASSQEWLEAKHKNFLCLVKVSIISGKNSDKLSKLKFVKNVIEKMGDVYLISEECLESPV